MKFVCKEEILILFDSKRIYYKKVLDITKLYIFSHEQNLYRFDVEGYSIKINGKIASVTDTTGDTKTFLQEDDFGDEDQTTGIQSISTSQTVWQEYLITQGKSVFINPSKTIIKYLGIEYPVKSFYKLGSCNVYVSDAGNLQLCSNISRKDKFNGSEVMKIT